MQRRTYVAAVAAGVVGGCLDGPGVGTATPDHDVTIRGVAVRPEMVVMATDVYNSYGEPGEQFVVATVETDGSLDAEDFWFLAAGETHGHDDDITHYSSLWNHGGRYHEDERWIVFRVANPLDADSAAITWPGGDQELDDAAVARLRRPPTDFEVPTYDAPESMAPEETATLTVVVENVGDVDGRFVAGLSRVGGGTGPYPLEGISMPLSAGERTTWEYPYGPYDPDRLREHDPFVSFRLDRRDGFHSVTTEFDLG